MKKAPILLLVVLACVSFLAGCRHNGYTLRIGIWDQNQQAGLEKVLAEFTKETGIRTKVEVTPWNDYWNLMETAASGGSLPDVFWIHSNEVQRYIASGQLVDLTDRIAGSAITSMSDFPADLVSLYSSGGRQYAIPKDLDTIALWYNKKHFDEAGLAYPTNDWVWHDMRAAAEKLTKPGRYGILFSPGETQTGYWNLIYQNGGYVVSPDTKKSGFDDPKTIEAMEFVIGMVNDGLAPPLKLAEGDSMGLMQDRVVSMAFFGSWMLSAFKRNAFFVKDCGVVVLPSSNSRKRATIYNGLGWTMSVTSKHQEEGWKLLEFLGGENAQRKLSETGIAISAFRGTTAPFARGFPEFNVNAYTDQIPWAVMRPYSKNGNAWEDMSVLILDDVWTGKKNMADACREIAQKMNAMLASE
ncbi:MAG: sugar ABC transporter substrate-binding protein [Treponema sp.]|nr:sugar ABC transporter substrate-binding protein [Treponema sp.]